jgi:hypothetical protein
MHGDSGLGLHPHPRPTTGGAWGSRSATIRGAEARRPPCPSPTTQKPAPKAEAPTKTDKVLSMLARANGASIAQIEKATGWQPHTVRAALTGLRKKGHAVERTKSDKGVSTYRLTEAAE